MVKELKKLAKNYWFAEESNIFRNYRDALAGFIVLVLVPAFSIIFTVHTDKYTFWGYSFPLIAVSLAGAYDTYGRYDGKSPKNVKLVIRIVFDFCAIFFSVLSLGVDSVICPYIAPILLTMCGLLLLYEMYIRIQLAIQISPWLF